MSIIQIKPIEGKKWHGKVMKILELKLCFS